MSSVYKKLIGKIVCDKLGLYIMLCLWVIFNAIFLND